ncbi:hypothetical protein PoB_000234200 [Plakobranchus ocellatus]|uniref:Uncharacterized protein n=1 Tax=Plakobranchus ocellatus TaxID=259542 RepID=A0AAV3Y079_9GAST|nr:hypothetical protein PoB_000234200 [Plakobranchus ocellatus]
MFLMNKESKKQLTQFLLHEYQQDYDALLLLNREVYFACDHQCFVLSSCDGKTTYSKPVPYLAFIHEEAYTFLILHAIHSDQNIVTVDTDIINRSRDTDVLLLMISFCELFTQPLYFGTGVGNISLSPPCIEALEPHILRANYQTSTWKQAHQTQPKMPKSKNSWLELSIVYNEVNNMCIPGGTSFAEVETLQNSIPEPDSTETFFYVKSAIPACNTSNGFALYELCGTTVCLYLSTSLLPFEQAVKFCDDMESSLFIANMLIRFYMI